jgi:hypothetical protein
MEQSPSREAKSRSVSQEITRLLLKIRRFITVFTRDRHRFLSWASRIQSTTSQPISWKYVS